MEQKKDIFLDIIERHKGIIYKITNAYCKDEIDRQDLIQEIIIQIWLSLDKYNKEYKLTTWLYRIALNTSISFYRKNKIRNENGTRLTPILESYLVADEPYRENPDLVILQGFIHELKEIDKALILLYLDGLSQKEIAAIIGITATNVGSKLSRIKRKLRQKFQSLKQQNYGG